MGCFLRILLITNVTLQYGKRGNCAPGRRREGRIESGEEGADRCGVRQ